MADSQLGRTNSPPSRARTRGRSISTLPPWKPTLPLVVPQVSRRFVALSAERMKEWMAADLSKLDLLVIQIDGIHIKEDLMLLAAVGIEGDGRKHPLGVIEGATENAAVVQALLDNLVGRGLDPAICRLFIIDGQGAVQGDPQHLRSPHPDPAVSGAQGPQHHRASCQAPSRQRAQGPAPGLGTGRRRQGRKADPQPRPPPGTRGPRRLRQHPGGPRRNPHRQPPRLACRVAPWAASAFTTRTRSWRKSW